MDVVDKIAVTSHDHAQGARERPADLGPDPKAYELKSWTPPRGEDPGRG